MESTAANMSHMVMSSDEIIVVGAACECTLQCFCEQKRKLLSTMINIGPRGIPITVSNTTCNNSAAVYLVLAICILVCTCTCMCDLYYCVCMCVSHKCGFKIVCFTLHGQSN